MKTVNAMERAIINSLNVYMETHRLNQIELAKVLGWSPSDLNDTLKGRKGIGKRRQLFLETKLGSSFKEELLRNFTDFSGRKQKQQTVKARCRVGKYILSDAEQTYVEKLIAVFRGPNNQAKLALIMNINSLYLLKRKKQEVSEKDFMVMSED